MAAVIMAAEVVQWGVHGDDGAPQPPPDWKALIAAYGGHQEFASAGESSSTPALAPRQAAASGKHDP